MPAVEILIELLRKISKSTDHVKIEGNYDGQEWTWRVTENNVTASQWTPKENRLEKKFPERHSGV